MRSRCSTVAPNISSYQAMAASRSRTAMPTWSISVSFVVMLPAPMGRSGPARFARSCAVPPEQGDLVLADLGPELGIVDPEPLFGGQAQHADLAFVHVVVHLVGRLAHLVEGIAG